MVNTRLSDEDIATAKRIWAEYQQTHDLSNRKGEMAGIDPATGEVWIGAWITDIAAQRRAEGRVSPLLFERIGYPTALLKRGRLRIDFPARTVVLERITTPSDGSKSP